MNQLRCPSCGKRVCDLMPDSTIEVPCKWCHTFIKYDKGTITTRRQKREPGWSKVEGTE